VKRSLAAILAAGAVVVGMVGPVYGGHAAFVTAAMVMGLSGAGLAVAHWFAAAQHAQRPLRTSFALAIGTAVAVVLVTVLAAAELMFVSNHDALVISAIVLAAAVVALRAARVASARVVDEVGAIRDALIDVGAGARTTRLRGGAATELAELADAANTMTAQLAREEARRDAADSARRNLVAAVSHDLRTPMTSLRLLVEAIEDDIVDDATRRRYLATMRTHVSALGSLIDDLFELSRLEAGDLEWSIQRIAVKDLVDETVAAMRVQAEAKGVAVRTDLPDDLRLAQADPEKLQRVLFNLIQNAIRHTPADGSVTVRASDAGDWVEIEVADTGAGIPADRRAAVFDAFARGDDARAGEGAGLGLAISRAIVEGHGGRIWLADGDGPGTRVRFVIPA
jgi:signal transduction histidine kinase